MYKSNNIKIKTKIIQMQFINIFNKVLKYCCTRMIFILTGDLKLKCLQGQIMKK